MTSEIRANTLKNRVGLGTVSFTNTGPVVSGIVTATTFVGALTGTASGNPTLSNGADNRIITATGANALTGETNLTWTGSFFETNGAAETWTMRARSGGPSSKIGFQNQYLTNGYTIGCGADNQSFVVYTGGNNDRLRIDSTGITTFSQNVFFNKDIDVDGHTNLDNVSIAGVTTATENINIDADNKKLQIGDGQDFQLYWDGSDALIDTPGAGRIRVRSPETRFENWNGLEVLARFVGGATGRVELYHDNGNKKFETTATGITVTGTVVATGADINGDLDVDGHTNLDNVSIAGVTTTTDNINIDADNKKLNIGDGLDLQLYHTGSRSEIINNTGDLVIQAGANSNLLLRDQTGAVHFKGAYGAQAEIYHAGTKRLETDSLGINVLGRLDVSGTGANDHLNVDSNTTRLRIGGYADMQLYHDSTNINYIENYNDVDLHIKSTYGGSPSKTQAKFIHDGAVELYHSGTKKIETTSTGVSISGDINVSGYSQNHFAPSANNTYDLGFSSYRWRNLYLGTLLDVDTGSSTDGHFLAKFNGAESSNHAGLNIAHYLCGSDDNRTGLYWEHQNVSNQRMWMGDDLRLYLKSSNPTSSTQNGRYIMTVAAGYPDFPSGSSADNAAYSALEIKKHYPKSQSGNYWIYDNNNTPRQIYCDMEIDGGGWMLWHDYNYGQTSMNEALGGSAASPSGSLARSNWGNYAYYNVLIRATDIDSTGERLHSIVQLDGNGALKRVADYGSEFLLEDVGDLYQPNLNFYFNDASTGEYVGNDKMYSPQCGATGWETFSGGGNSAVFIREMDSRITPGMHRSCHLVERIYGFDDNGVPNWAVAESMHPMPFFGDVMLGGEVADGNMNFMFENNRQIDADNGNNGAYAQGRMKGVLTGQFEVEFKLGYSWGWSQAVATSTIQIAENLRDEANPYAMDTGAYAYFGIRNNNSNNQWDPFYRQPWTNGNYPESGGAAFSVGHVLWRVADGTIYARRKDGTHGTKNLGKFAGPLIMTSGTQSVMRTEWMNCWNADKSDNLGSRRRWYK